MIMLLYHKQKKWLVKLHSHIQQQMSMNVFVQHHIDMEELILDSTQLRIFNGLDPSGTTTTASRPNMLALAATEAPWLPVE